MSRVTIATENNEPVEQYYEVQGEGRPVVLVHGWPLSGRSWENQVSPVVTAGYQVVTYDRRGFVQSSSIWEGHDYDTAARDLEVLLAHLDVSEATLVGFSAGGGTVARYLGTYGDARVAQAVFASSVTPFLHASEANPEGGLDDATIGYFEGAIAADRAAFIDQFMTMFYSTNDGLVTSEAQRVFGRDLAGLASLRATFAGVSAFSRTDFRADLAKIDVPTLVIHGDADQVVPIEVSGNRTSQAVTGSELVVIEGGPHGINVSHAAQFNAALLDFLTRADTLD
jgi:pimeloyl-ACP methyl ester carboxylesterase